MCLSSKFPTRGTETLAGSVVWTANRDPCQQALAKGQNGNRWVASSSSLHRGQVLWVGIPLFFRLRRVGRPSCISFHMKLQIFRGTFTFQIRSDSKPPMDMNPSQDLWKGSESPHEAACRHSFWHLFSYGRVNDRTNLDIKQSSMTMRSISCLFFFPYFFPYVNCSIWKLALDCFLSDHSGNLLGLFFLQFLFLFFLFWN